MGTITIKQTDNASNSYSGEGLEIDEFIPYVKLRNTKGYEIVDHELPLDKDNNGKLVYVDLLAQTSHIKKQTAITTLPTELKKFIIPFDVEQVTEDSMFQDEDGYLEVELSLEKDKFVKVEGATAKLKLKTKTEFSNKLELTLGTEIDVQIEITEEKSFAFYLRFIANDNEDSFKGNYQNVFCGCFKVKREVPNEWEFSKEKIDKIRVYAKKNYQDVLAHFNKRSEYRKYSDYHHCTDTHKHIIYKLLDNPSSLILGKDQIVGRDTPKDFEKAGESTTHGVRNTTIAATYAEPSKTFTVIDINNNEVLTNGQPGNTDNALKSFKESPVDYMKSKCPDNGYYVFIGAYNDDYHSFTIIAIKEDETFKFQFVDQLVGVADYTENDFESSKLLVNIYEYRFNFPLKLELYQLRNKKK